ncbi:DUF1707 SHOCT-like domain-containing protein [Nocardiopsis composta]|uniref:DUF1707 domain-containing protein n=1 Tax=Nocardiopsis composta TaxID=157465 RepID=A0A7W8VGA5_9ACTN|nr:DUF1707 domain-containing protein [Nocardiopsis composta]MBB5435446.1 hypothetical protein [Nocardiopsis composta]
MDPQPQHRGDIRVSDAERDVTAQRLAAALSEGRLDMEEYQKRLDAAMTAVTADDLRVLTVDLPPAAGAAPAPVSAEGPVDLAAMAPPARPSFWRGQLEEWRSWGGGAVIMIGIWTVTSIVSGQFLPFWPLIPLGIWAAVLIAGMLFGDGKSSKCGS